MSFVNDPLKSVKDQIRGFVPSKFQLVITHPCSKTLRVAIDLSGYPHQHAMQKAMKGKNLPGISLQRTNSGMKLIISGPHSKIIERMKTCKEQLLIAA